MPSHWVPSLGLPRGWQMVDYCAFEETMGGMRWLSRYVRCLLHVSKMTGRTRRPVSWDSICLSDLVGDGDKAVCDRSATCLSRASRRRRPSGRGSLSLKQPTQSQRAQRAVRKREKRTPQRSARRTLNYVETIHELLVCDPQLVGLTGNHS